MSVVYFPREIFINLRRRRTYQRDRYCYPRENYETSSLISNCNIIRISSYDFSVFPIFLHAWKFIMILYERVTAHASYGPAFRQTRQHCRRPIIRAAANSTSVHDAAQSWRTTVNWDCLVIRVNTIGKKRYFEERSANVRSEMLYIFDHFQLSLWIYIDIIKTTTGLFALLFCERTSIYMIEPIELL